MPQSPPPSSRQTDLAPAEDFFADAWAVYRAVVENDYLWHSAAGRSLARVLGEHFPADRPVRFLDLACGDADAVARALAGRSMARYVGVDRSDAALASAAASTGGLAKLGCPIDLVAADYLDYLRTAPPGAFDVIYVGLSAHHLNDRLADLFTAARPCLAEGGVLVAYEPFALADETRDEQVARLCAIARQLWVALSPAQRDQVERHVSTEDFPVTLDRWNALAEAAGFDPARRLFRSPDRLYEMVCHTCRTDT